MPPSHNSNNDVAPLMQDAERASTLVGRNITVGGRRTSIRLEMAMWDGLHDIAVRERLTIHQIASAIDRQKDPHTSLTSAMRVFIMAYYRAAATEAGHRRAGHGQGRGDMLPAFQIIQGAA